MAQHNADTWLDLADTASGGGHSVSLYWSPAEPDRIRLIFSDPRIVDAQGEKPGLQIVFSANPKSADYSPANFNRCARLLRAEGRPAPDQDVEEHPRHLRYRDNIIATVTGGGHATSPGSRATPTAVPVHAVACDRCEAYVRDLAQHTKAAHPTAPASTITP